MAHLQHRFGRFLPNLTLNAAKRADIAGSTYLPTFRRPSDARIHHASCLDEECFPLRCCNTTPYDIVPHPNNKRRNEQAKNGSACGRGCLHTAHSAIQSLAAGYYVTYAL